MLTSGDINLTGTFNRGHYTAFFKQPNTLSWLFCNDAPVGRSFVEKINDTSSYIYEAIFKKAILPCFVRGLGYLCFSLVVTTLHIIPVILQFFKEYLSCKKAWMSFLVFRWNDPTYCPSFITQYGNNFVGLEVVFPHCKLHHKFLKFRIIRRDCQDLVAALSSIPIHSNFFIPHGLALWKSILHSPFYLPFLQNFLSFIFIDWQLLV